jgi:hypothetical protein
MIAIGLLFVRMLCDYFKSRPQPEAKIVRQVGRYAVRLIERIHRARPTISRRLLSLPKTRSARIDGVALQGSGAR